MHRLFLPIPLLLLLAGCAGTSPPTYFYSLEGGSIAQAPPLAAMPELDLGLGPIALPDTLDRPQMVSRGERHRVELAEFHRWAGELRADMGRLMAARLMQRLGTQRLSLHPWPRQRRLDRQVRVEVLRFDGRLGGEALLKGNWTLLDGRGERELLVEGFALSEPVGGAEYADMVDAQSRLSNRLADAIAEGIVKHAGK